MEFCVQGSRRAVSQKIFIKNFIFFKLTFIFILVFIYKK